MPEKLGDQKFDHPHPQGLSFCGQGSTFHVNLVMLSKSRT